MHADQTPFEPSAPEFAAAPPTHAGDFVPLAPPEGWPMVIGVLAIVFGSLGTLCGGCGMAASFSAPMLVGMLPADPQFDEARQALQQATQHMGVQAGMQLLELTVSVILLVGGIQLVRRKAKAATTLTVFAVGDLFANTVTAVGSVMLAQAQVQSASGGTDAQTQAAATAAAAMQPITIIMTSVFAVLGWLLYAIWPVFLLIWFRRAKIRASMGAWG